jgi:Family of unknown function (DUF5923)
LKWLLDTLQNYRGHGKESVKKAGDHGQGIFSSVSHLIQCRRLDTNTTQDPSLKQAATELRTLLERFANGKSMDDIVDAINALYDDANRDEELREWFKSVDSYSRKVCLSPV